MKSGSAHEKANRNDTDARSRDISGGKNAVGLIPPASEIDFVNSGLPCVAPVQRIGRLDGAEGKAPLQGKFNLPPAQSRQMQPRPASNRTGMPDGLKAGVESLSGMDLSDVRVSFNSEKPAQLNALAYAQGNEIHLAPGQERHLPHEAWHVVQQRQGRVVPTLQAKGVAINNDAGLEHEADAMGAKAAQVKGGLNDSGPASVSVAQIAKARTAGDRRPGRPTGSGVIQRNIGFEFELPDCFAMEPTAAPVPGAAIGGAAAAGKNNLAGYRPVPRHGLIMSGSGYRLEGEGTSARPRIEFVTDAFAENSAGRKSLQSALNAINWVCGAIESATKASPEDLIPATKLRKFWHGNTTINKQHALVKGDDDISIKPQSTAGIRLDRMSHVFENLGTGTKPRGEQAGRYALAGPGVAQIGTITGNVGPALANYVNDVHNVKKDSASAEMRSLLYLVALYIVKARTYARRPKYIAPFMLRTDFATTFNLLPERQTTFVAGNAGGRALWLSTCLAAAGLNGGNASDRFLATIGEWQGLQVDTDPNHVTLQQWLDAIYDGKDLFTQANYPVAAAQPDMESPGGLGAKTDMWFDRYDQGTPAPIIEFRMMRQGFRSTVTAQALDVYDYVVALNQAGMNALPDLTFFHNRKMEKTSDKAVARRKRTGR